MAQVHVPLQDANTALASHIPRGEFSKIAENSEAVIAFQATPQGTSFYQVRKEPKGVHVPVLQAFLVRDRVDLNLTLSRL